MLFESASLDLSSDRIILDFLRPRDFEASAASGAMAGTEGLPRAALSLRSSGSLRYLKSAANPQRETFFRTLGLESDRLIGTELHHTRRIRFLDAAPSPDHGAFERDAESCPGEDWGDGGPDGAEGRDGLIVAPGAARLGLVPCVTVADCMPIWLCDFSAGAYGVLHSGWKGTGILRQAVEGLASRHGSRAQGISLILGPSIGPCCYEVPSDRREYFRREFGEGSVRGGSIDLREANLALCERLGLGAVLSLSVCTSCSPELGSYRREGPGSFTRMAAAVGRFGQA